MEAERGRSIAEVEKLMNAIKADAEYFRKKWNQNITDQTLVQFCIDNLSFLVKLIVNTKNVDLAEIAQKIAKISPALEKRLRSSAPTILSKYALQTRQMHDITWLLEKKFSVISEDDPAVTWEKELPQIAENIKRLMEN
jgi:hypothetical protein